MASATDTDTLKLYEDITSFLELEDNPFFFSLKDELQTFPDNMIERVSQKLKEIVEDEPFKFKTTILNLILIHEYRESKDYATAGKIIDDLDQEIRVLAKDQDVLFSKISVVLRNILITYKICMTASNNVEEAHKMLNDIIPFSNLNKSNEAAIYGIRSSVFMEYGLYGNKSALTYAKKANLIDPSNSYWFFLIGKCLGRIRRVEKPYDIPSNEERNVLKKAIEMDDNYLFTLFTAEVYAETANRTFKFHVREGTLYPSLKLSIDQLNEEASTFYKKSIEKQPDCTHVLFRVAKGFLNLPYPQKNPDYAKELLLKGLKIAPRNPFGNHLLAKFYERYDKNIDLAIKHLKICVEQNVFGAHMDMLKIEYQRNQVNIPEKLRQLLNIFVETPRKLQILTQLASYYIFVNPEPDLVNACELMKECVKMNYDENVSNHRSLFVQLKQPFSLIDVLIDEIKIEMENNCPSDKLRVYKEFLSSMTESNIMLPKGRAKNLRNKILFEEQELKIKYSQGKHCRKMNKPTKNNTFFKSAAAPRMKNSYQRSKPESVQNARLSNEHSGERVDVVRRTCDFFDSWKRDVESSENICKKEISFRNEFSIRKDQGKRDFTNKKSQNKKTSVLKSHQDYNHPFQVKDIDISFEHLKISSEPACTTEVNRNSKLPSKGNCKSQTTPTIESDSDDDLMSFLRDK